MRSKIDYEYYYEVLNDDERAALFQEILTGLNKDQKELPPKLFYDEYGSQLFDQITELKAYYPTRTETKIMEENVEEISQYIGEQSVLIEYGSGSSTKTRILLDYLSERISGYISIDISEDYLLKVANNLRALYPKLWIHPVAADYTKPFIIPDLGEIKAKRIAYFPGSTIGNFYPEMAVEFLMHVNTLVKRGGGLLIGVDLKKDVDVLNLAYNDPEGITAEFNLNMLTHINREFGADFCIERFSHKAFYNQTKGRIEMHLSSNCPQVINLLDNEIFINEGETIRTEVSYKYALKDFEYLVKQAGFQVEKIWVDEKKLFSVQFLRAV